MKILLMSLCMLVSTSAFSMSTDAIRTAILCEEGYTFLLVFSSGSNRPPTVVQIFETIGENSRPMRCAGPDRILQK
jgi:hypothetical protein